MSISEPLVLYQMTAASLHHKERPVLHTAMSCRPTAIERITRAIEELIF